MSFYLYTLHENQFIRERQLPSGALWAEHGAVATCGRSKVSPTSGGLWCVNETDLLRFLHLPDFGNDEPTNPNLLQYALIDDLVPNGPDIAMARVKRIKGFLDKPYCGSPCDPTNTDDRYNPFIIEMEEVLLIPSWELPKDVTIRNKRKENISSAITPSKVIRSVSYFRNGWRLAGRLNAALLWSEHWTALTHDQPSYDH
jgi:hypothetical protein